jgi:hypothetical protein
LQRVGAKRRVRDEDRKQGEGSAECLPSHRWQRPISIRRLVRCSRLCEPGVNRLTYVSAARCGGRVGVILPRRTAIRVAIPCGRPRFFIGLATFHRIEPRSTKSHENPRKTVVRVSSCDFVDRPLYAPKE